MDNIGKYIHRQGIFIYIYTPHLYMGARMRASERYVFTIIYKCHGDNISRGFTLLPPAPELRLLLPKQPNVEGLQCEKDNA